MAIIFGTSDNDTISTSGVSVDVTGGPATDLADVIAGLAGDDLILAGDGADEIAGGDGDDTLAGEAGADTLSGGAGADTLDGNLGADSLAGGDGNDVYTVDDAGDVVEEGAEGGVDAVVSSLDHLLASTVEHLTLTGAARQGTGNALDNRVTGTAEADTLWGGSGADTLLGAAGADSLDGGTGSDQLLGGAGDDSYEVDDAADAVMEMESGGTDGVLARVDWTLSDWVEGLTLAAGSGADEATGNALANTLTGASLADTLRGMAGADTLEGGGGDDRLDGGSGDDRMDGGAGSDTYLVDQAGDQVMEGADGGTDLVRATVSHALAEHVEDLVLLGMAGLRGSGNLLANRISGTAGADTLEGGGGADTLEGGGGGDAYRMVEAADRLVEMAGGGEDTVFASVSLTLADQVEALILDGATEAALAGTGNALGNLLVGHAGTATLDGAAGDDTVYAEGGADLLRGGSGNDVLLGGDGDDWVYGDAGGDWIVGDAGADVLWGMEGRDVLDGGAGLDVLIGGTGDDVYVVDSIGDSMWEEADGGFDIIVAGGADFIWMGAEVEQIWLTGANAGAMGNAGANLLYGSNANNWLEGGEGDDTVVGAGGADAMIGGTGRDEFVLLEGEVAGAILDFTLGEDVLWLVGQGVGSFEEVQARLWQVDGSTVLALDSGALWFAETRREEFSAADFAFA